MGQERPETVDIKQRRYDSAPNAAAHHIKASGQVSTEKFLLGADCQRVPSCEDCIDEIGYLPMDIQGQICSSS